jgi:hypothetical protein
MKINKILYKKKINAFAGSRKLKNNIVIYFCRIENAIAYRLYCNEKLSDAYKINNETESTCDPALKYKTDYDFLSQKEPVEKILIQNILI